MMKIFKFDRNDLEYSTEVDFVVAGSLEEAWAIMLDRFPYLTEAGDDQSSFNISEIEIVRGAVFSVSHHE